ncbi:MAG: S8 family serine peptidase [Sulfuricella sp.]|nr:S8 family serine peptidase [Sulfuricella sp.]
MGVAKGATLVIAKITNGCTGYSDESTQILAFNWLAANAPAGTIVNFSLAYSNADNNCFTPFFSLPLENAIIAAHNAGIIVVVAAGNDGCDTANFSPTNIPQAFVVGATTQLRLPGVDAKWYLSRTGWNISTFSPGRDVRVMDQNGSTITASGTSFAAPYVAGIFAIACQTAGTTYCKTRGTANLYTDLRNTGTLNTVTNSDGTPLTGATSRFIRQQW